MVPFPKGEEKVLTFQEGILPFAFSIGAEVCFVRA